MILVVDTYIDGKKETHEVSKWTEALDLYATASECPRILACSIRDLRHCRFLASEFVRPGVNNFLRMRMVTDTVNLTVSAPGNRQHREGT